MKYKRVLEPFTKLFCNNKSWASMDTETPVSMIMVPSSGQGPGARDLFVAGGEGDGRVEPASPLHIITQDDVSEVQNFIL